MSFLRNPVTSARRVIGCVVVLVGLILCIPSIAGFFIANGIYERSYIGGSDDTVMTSPFNGQVFTININGKLKAGHNYDIVVKINSIQGPNTMAQTGLLSMSLSVTGGLSHSDTVTTGNFNETTAISFNKWEITDNLVADVDLTFTLTITALTDVTSGQIEIRIYQDPARFWVNLINTVSFWLLIPGALVICCGCCIAPPQRRSRYR